MNRKITTVIIIILILGLSLFLSGCDNFSLIELLNNDISLVPGEVTLYPNETIKFEVSAGVAPFTFTEIGDGIIPNGVYIAPTAGSYTILVEDYRSRTAGASITVLDLATQVLLSPELVSIGMGGVISFIISGGTSPYNISLEPGIGSHDHPGDNSLTFDYTAGLTAGEEVIRVTDNLGQTSEAYVTITNSSDLMISPSIVELLLGETVQFSASGGITTSYSYSQVSGDGSFVSATRIYTAPSTLGGPTAVIRVDDTSSTSDATIYIVENAFTINPSLALTLYVGNQFTFSAFNGTPPYSYSILGNEPSGSINSTSGLFTALIKDNNVTVVAEDSRGTTSTCRVKIKN